MATIAKTAAIASMSGAEKTQKIVKLESSNKELRSELSDVVASSNKKINAFVRQELPQIATYAGAGAAIGGLLGYYLFDKMREWFGADSYVGLLSTAVVGVVVIYAAPSLVKVTRKSIGETGPTQAAVYGLGVGLVAVGAWRAYQEWPQS